MAKKDFSKIAERMANRDFETTKTVGEVDILIDRVFKQQNTGSKFPGMSYEDGICAMYNWLTGDVEEDPMGD